MLIEKKCGLNVGDLMGWTWFRLEKEASIAKELKNYFSFQTLTKFKFK